MVSFLIFLTGGLIWNTTVTTYLGTRRVRDIVLSLISPSLKIVFAPEGYPPPPAPGYNKQYYWLFFLFYAPPCPQEELPPQEIQNSPLIVVQQGSDLLLDTIIKFCTISPIVRKARFRYLGRAR